MKTASGSLQLCAGIEAGITEATHAMAQQQWERTAQAHGVRANEDLEEGSTAGEAKDARGGVPA